MRSHQRMPGQPVAWSLAYGRPLIIGSWSLLSLLELILSKPYLMPRGGMEIPSNWDGGCRQLERDESGAWQL